MKKLLSQVLDMIVSFGLWIYALYILFKAEPTVKDVAGLCAIMLVVVLGNQSRIDTISEKLK